MAPLPLHLAPPHHLTSHQVGATNFTWHGGVLAPDGRIVALPYNSKTILQIGEPVCTQRGDAAGAPALAPGAAPAAAAGAATPTAGAPVHANTVQ